MSTSQPHAKSTTTPSKGLFAVLSGLFTSKGTTMPSTTPSAQGPVRPQARRLPLAILTALALLTSLAFAASASAAPPSATAPDVSNVSYASAKLKAKVTNPSPCPCSFGLSTYTFQYSTDNTNWHNGPGKSLSGAYTNKEVEATLGESGEPIKGGTLYYVRLIANNFQPGEGEATSPGPNPSFTTLVADPPSVEQTDDATEVKYTTVSVSGKVNRPEKSNDLTCNFEYITDKAFSENPSGEEFLGAAQAPCETDPPAANPGVITAPGPNPITAKLTGLTNATTYHLRLAVANASYADAKEAASTFITQAVDPPTVVSVDDAADVFSRSASVAGEIERPADPDPAFDIVACQFEYVTADQFGATGFDGAGVAGCVEPIDNSLEAKTSVTAALGSLDPETTYHLRLAAYNAAAAPGTKEAAATFTTTAKVAKPTVIKVDNATGIDQDSAKVSGEVERPAGVDPALDVTCHAEYVTEASYQGNEEQMLRVFATGGTYTAGFKGVSTAPLAFNAPAATVQAALAGLPGIGAGNVSVRGGPGNYKAIGPYLVVFVGALANKDVEEMTTDPSEIADVASGKSGASVQTLADGGHAPGFVNPARTDCDPLAPGAGAQEAKVGIFGLLPATTYHLRLTAENGGGTDTKDAAATFTTPPNFPASAVVGPITDISYGGATLSGEAEGDGLQVGFEFQVSTDGVNWTTVSFEQNGYPEKLIPLTPAVITGLEGGTKYFVRIRVIDTGGGNTPNAPTLAFSQPPYSSFTTLPVDPPTVIKADDATDVTAETAMVSGEIERPANPDPAFDANCRFDVATEAQFQANGYQSALQVPCGIDSLTTPGEKKAVEAELTGLRSGTKYHLRLTATNAGPDASLQAASTFTTVAVPAEVTTTAGGSDNEGGYHLAGLVNPRNSTISECKFVYGPTSEADFKKYPFAVPCSPLPDGVNERQRVAVAASGGQFKLSFGGQITGDIPFDAEASVVQTALESLSSIGPSGVSGVTHTFERAIYGPIHIYEVTFSGPLAGSNQPPLKAVDGTKILSGSVGVSTITEGRANTPISVEGHVTGLTPGNEYHFRLVATNAFGPAVTPDRTFVPTLAVKQPCPDNEQERTESNSLALPECRAYEMVTPPGKEGFNAGLETYDSGIRVAYTSGATNIAKSGQGAALYPNRYVAVRSVSGWETIPNLNGSSGALRDAPGYVVSETSRTVLEAYSSDLLSSIWFLHQQGDPEANKEAFLHLRSPDGNFGPIGSLQPAVYASTFAFDASADLSHVVYAQGSGLYEFIGTDDQLGRRVDLDNSGAPISTCSLGSSNRSISSDGNTIVNYVYGGCGAGNPPVGGLWARVNGTTAFDLSASQCNRTAGDPGGICNGPAEPGGCEERPNGYGNPAAFGCRNPTFLDATPDGSRVFFATTQQLVDEDTDETYDIYACDIPTGNPAPTAEKANHCAALKQVSGAQTGAEVEVIEHPNSAIRTFPGEAFSEDGSTAYFVAQGVLADNEDALKEKAVPGDHNLYVWRADASHPDGQTTFVGRLDANDLVPTGTSQGGGPQATPDGRYLVFTTATPLLDTDTDTARDVYRYDADTGALNRVSTNVFGVAGNGDAFPAAIAIPAEHHPTTTVSDDGTKIVFTTAEALSPADGNAEPDVYLWTPSRVSLISTGSSGFAPREEYFPGGISSPHVAIDPSGKDVYFESLQALTPADGDSSNDVYDARIGGGFSFAPPPICTGETCQPPVTPKPFKQDPGSGIPGPGNPPVKKPCPKGKVRKKNGKCVKTHKKHSGKKHHGKKGGHKQGGGK